MLSYYYAQDLASGCRSFAAQSDPKDASSWAQLARLPVANSSECALLLSTIADACHAHNLNRNYASRAVVRRVCGLMEEGLVVGVEGTREWCRAVRLLFSCEPASEMLMNSLHITAFASADGLPMLLTVQESFREDELISSLAVESLGLLARVSPSANVELMSRGRLKVVYSLMATHLRSSRLQLAALGILLHLLESPPIELDAGGACQSLLDIPVKGDVVDAVGMSGAIARLYAAMDAHPSCFDVQLAACGVLCALVPVNESLIYSNALRVITSGGLLRVYAAMEAYLTSAPLQSSVLKMLAGFTREKANAVMIASTGGLRLLCAVLDAHLASPALQTQACVALWTFCLPPDTKAAVVRAGGLARFYAAMERHPTVENLQQAACGGLRNLAVNAECRDAIVSSGGLERLCRAMSLHPKSALVLDVACGAFQNLAGETEYQKAIMSCGGLDRLYAAMAALPAAEELQVSCVRVLNNFCIIKDHIPILKAGQAAALIRKAVDNHPRNVSLVTMGRGLLTLL